MVGNFDYNKINENKYSIYINKLDLYQILYFREIEIKNRKINEKRTIHNQLIDTNVKIRIYINVNTNDNTNVSFFNKFSWSKPTPFTQKNELPVTQENEQPVNKENENTVITDYNKSDAEDGKIKYIYEVIKTNIGGKSKRRRRKSIKKKRRTYKKR